MKIVAKCGDEPVVKPEVKRETALSHGVVYSRVGASSKYMALSMSSGAKAVDLSNGVVYSRTCTVNVDKIYPDAQVVLGDPKDA
jgi:hypothetical protein